MSSASFRARCLFQVCVNMSADVFACVFWPAASFRASTKASTKETSTKRLRKKRTKFSKLFSLASFFFRESFAKTLCCSFARVHASLLVFV